jgi:hypothetical protein
MGEAEIAALKVAFSNNRDWADWSTLAVFGGLFGDGCPLEPNPSSRGLHFFSELLKRLELTTTTTTAIQRIGPLPAVSRREGRQQSAPEAMTANMSAGCPAVVQKLSNIHI